MDNERPFIDGEFTVVREDHGVIIWQPSRGRGFRSKRRRMPNGDSTANVGDLLEIHSQGHLILRVTGEMDKEGLAM